MALYSLLCRPWLRSWHCILCCVVLGYVHGIVFSVVSSLVTFMALYSRLCRPWLHSWHCILCCRPRRQGELLLCLVYCRVGMIIRCSCVYNCLWYNYCTNTSHHYRETWSGCIYMGTINSLHICYMFVIADLGPTLSFDEGNLKKCGRVCPVCLAPSKMSRDLWLIFVWNLFCDKVHTSLHLKGGGQCVTVWWGSGWAAVYGTRWLGHKFRIHAPGIEFHTLLPWESRITVVYGGVCPTMVCVGGGRWYCVWYEGYVRLCLICVLCVTCWQSAQEINGEHLLYFPQLFKFDHLMTLKKLSTQTCVISVLKSDSFLDKMYPDTWLAQTTGHMICLNTHDWLTWQSPDLRVSFLCHAIIITEY